MIEIIDYAPIYQPQFYQLNIEWLDKFNLTEPYDLQLLNNPTLEVIEKAGFIWLAKHNNQVVGTSALLKKEHGVYEIAKMTVAKAYRGKGISKLLLDACIAKAKQIQAVKLLLFSNHQLTTALKLYEQYGFAYVEVLDSHFVTADIKMEMIL
jgi:putative acetyltransferase